MLLAAALSSVSFAQSAPPASNTTPQNISGKWSGSFEIHKPDGQVEQSTALLILKQTGDTVTGTVGPNEEDQLPVKEGKVVGSEIQLNAETRDGEPIVFHLHLEGYHLKGDVTSETPDGKITAKIDVTLQQPSPSNGASIPPLQDRSIARIPA